MDGRGCLDRPFCFGSFKIALATPIFQQGEHVIRRGEATRYFKGKNGWSNTTGMLWLTNQRLVYWAGFGNQRNWPLDHVVKVQTGIIDTVATVTVEFDNGMVEWFALEEQHNWISAISGAVPRRPEPKPTPEVSENPTPSSPPKSNRRVLIVAVAAMGVGFLLCVCAAIAAAAMYFLPTNFAG